jgi:hypothetical protein
VIALIGLASVGLQACKSSPKAESHKTPQSQESPHPPEHVNPILDAAGALRFLDTWLETQNSTSLFPGVQQWSSACGASAYPGDIRKGYVTVVIPSAGPNCMPSKTSTRQLGTKQSGIVTSSKWTLATSPLGKMTNLVNTSPSSAGLKRRRGS